MMRLHFPQKATKVAARHNQGVYACSLKGIKYKDYLPKLDL